MGDDSSVHSEVGLSPDLCRRVRFHPQTRNLREPKATSNSDLEWLTPKERREFVATDGRIILVTGDMMDSGNGRHKTVMQKTMRERFPSGKYRTLQCDEGGTFDGRWTYMENTSQCD